MPSIVWLTVRDELSRDALLAQASDALRDRSIDLVRDPGLLASRHFPLDAPRTDGLVGLCLTDPLALRYHGGEGDARSIAQWFGDLIKALTAQGREVLLFTNGSPEDRHFLARHAAQWQAIDTARVHVAPPPDEPAALVRTIAGCSLVIAHRMHACIAAHSFGIPTIGLRWDAKLDAFFCLAGRSNYLHTAGITPVAEVAASAGQAVAEGVDRQACDSLIAEAAGDVSTLARTLREAAK